MLVLLMGVIYTPLRWYHEDWSGHSGNVKVITSTI
jgi:hypothetical protein